MAEIKRVFQGGKMERDVDDRLVKNGDYRYANNVNVGESEGGDVGALENLKGNELIPGQEDIVGTTIGSVRDPNNDKIYWFTTSDETNAIYEYDGTEVRTILKDDASRPNPKPTCVPDFTTDINEPVSDSGARDALDFTFMVPVGGCMTESANNYVPLATFQQGICTFDPVGETDDPIATITGGQTAMPAGTITFTGGISLGQQLGVANVLVAGSQSWAVSGHPTTITNGGSDGDANISFSSPDAGDVTVTFSFMVTQDDASVISSNVASRVGTFTAAQTFTFAATSVLADPNEARVIAEGGVPSEQGIMGTPEQITWTSVLRIADPTAFTWTTNPTETTVGLPGSHITIDSLAVVNTNNPASTLFSGMWDPTGPVEVLTTWSGIALTATPVVPAFTCSLPNGFPTSVLQGSTGNSFVLRINSNFAATGVGFAQLPGGGMILTSPLIPITGTDSFRDPGSLNVGDNDFTITFDVRDDAIGDVDWSFLVTNKDPFDGGPEAFNARCSSEDLPGSDDSGVFSAPILSPAPPITGITLTRPSNQDALMVGVGSRYDLRYTGGTPMFGGTQTPSYSISGSSGVTFGTTAVNSVGGGSSLSGNFPGTFGQVVSFGANTPSGGTFTISATIVDGRGLTRSVSSSFTP